MAKDILEIQETELKFDATCPEHPGMKTELKIPIAVICTEKEGKDLILTFYNVCTHCGNSHRYVLLRRKI